MRRSTHQRGCGVIKRPICKRKNFSFVMGQICKRLPQKEVMLGYAKWGRKLFVRGREPTVDNKFLHHET